VPQNDEIAQFIARIERNDAAFQRVVSRAKVRSLKNFYEMAVTQPPIPGTVLLFTSDKLGFRALEGQDNVGHLQEPTSKYLIIDGQHRLAALRFYLSEHPEEAKGIDVPCVIFDGRSEDFAADANQQKPPRRSLRARILGRPGPALCRASGRQSLQRVRQSVALSHQPAGRPQP
jgi:hypothetical protein